MIGPPPIRPPAGHDVERLFHTQAGPLTLRGPERLLEQVRILALPRRRPYDWQRDERDPIAVAHALFDQGVVPAADWRAEALTHLRSQAAAFRQAFAADPIDAGRAADAPLAHVRMSVDLRAVEVLG